MELYESQFEFYFSNEQYISLLYQVRCANTTIGGIDIIREKRH
jgi:hypothetical protein